MAGTFIYFRAHIIFSTKNRKRFINPEMKDRLIEYIGGIIKSQNGKLLKANALDDHIHLYASLKSEPSIASLLRLIKANSSTWIKKTFPKMSSFGWQLGYGFFVVSPSQEKTTIRYIQKQEEHHKKRTFKEEYILFLKKHNIEYDKRYIWD